MLKYLFISFLFIALFEAEAKIYVVKLGFGNQYITPNNVEVFLSDTVRFVNYGTFNTTTSLSVPSGARNWDIDLKAFKNYFDLKMEVEGLYEFHSQTHPQHRATIYVKGAAVPSKPYMTQNTQHEFFDFYVGFNLTAQVEVKIYDLLGKLLIDKKVVLKQGKGQFNSKILGKGIYFFKVYQDYKQVFFYKFLKE